MKTPSSSLVWSFALAVSGGLLAGPLARAAAEDRIEKSFEVGSGGRLILEADRGSIEIRGGTGNTVHVQVERKASRVSTSKGEELLKDHVVEFTQEGDTVTIRAKYPNPKLLSWSQGNLQVRFQITVPERFNVDAKTAGGSVQVAQVQGEVTCGTSGGSLSFEGIRGKLDGNTSGGSIKVTESEGPAHVRTSGGGIQLSAVRGEVTATTSGGSISAKDLVGKTVLKTSGGSISLDNLEGAVDARTSGGSIQTTFHQGPAGDCYLGTSGGGITVTLPPNAELEVDARTSGGGVSSELPVTMVVQGDQKRNQLQGKINGGGPKLTARTSGGGIKIKKVG